MNIWIKEICLRIYSKLNQVQWIEIWSLKWGLIQIGHFYCLSAALCVLNRKWMKGKHGCSASQDLLACLCVRFRLASVLKDIQHLCHFPVGSEAHKRSSLGNDGPIKENRNTNPDSIMEWKGKFHLLWWSHCLDLIVSNLLSIFEQGSGQLV